MNRNVVTALSALAGAAALGAGALTTIELMSRGSDPDAGPIIREGESIERMVDTGFNTNDVPPPVIIAGETIKGTNGLCRNDNIAVVAQGNRLDIDLHDGGNKATIYANSVFGRDDVQALCAGRTRVFEDGVLHSAHVEIPRFPAQHLDQSEIGKAQINVASGIQFSPKRF